MKDTYIDKYGKLWTRIDDYYVWCPETGYGVWDNGKGLTAI